MSTVPTPNGFRTQGLSVTESEAFFLVNERARRLPFTLPAGQRLPLQVATTVVPFGTPLTDKAVNVVLVFRAANRNVTVGLIRRLREHDRRRDRVGPEGSRRRPLSRAVTVNVFCPGAAVSIGAPLGTGPAQEAGPEPPASSAQL